jgi:hypothetical protein
MEAVSCADFALETSLTGCVDISVTSGSEGLYKVAQTIWREDCEIEIKASFRPMGLSK